MILDGLSLSITDNTYRVVRQSTVNMLMTCIDRKISDRVYMADLIADVININDMIRRVQMLNELVPMLEDKEHPVDPQAFSERMTECLGTAEGIRKKLVAKMQLVLQMPYEDDTIH